VIEVLLQAESALSLGLLDRAEILYRQVVIADPRNSIAVVGLARVALERGDEPGALHQARRALAIDSENAAARRMVQRLEEILRYRGVEIPAAPADAAPAPGAGPTPTAAPAVPGAGAREADVGPQSSPSSAPGPWATEPVPPPRSVVDRLLRRR